jgi:hydrogenase maturation protease
MTLPRILIAGIGNIFLGDDGFGVEVIRQLALLPWPDGVELKDYGIRGLDLAFALLDSQDLIILVDALAHGGTAGTLYVIEPDLDELGEADIQTHNVDPVQVLKMVKAFGGTPEGIIRLVGCEPATFGSEGEGIMGLSDPVTAAIPKAVETVTLLVKTFLSEYYQQEGENMRKIPQKE